MKKFIFGSYVYEYDLRHEDRKTLSLTVNPDLSLVVKCPDHATDERIEHFLKKKWLWLQKQINYFNKFKRKKYHKEYVSGESFRYLGKQYMLQVKEDGENKVVLSKGKLVLHSAMYTSDVKYNRLLVKRWYTQKTRLVFNERFEEVLNNFDYQKKPSLGIRQMNKRWGSYLNKDKILLNPRLIEASKDCIDYVITHELCHIKYKDHDKRFYKLLDEKCPGWKKVKDKLESYLG